MCGLLDEMMAGSQGGVSLRHWGQVAVPQHSLDRQPLCQGHWAALGDARQGPSGPQASGSQGLCRH